MIIDIDSHFEPGSDWLEPYPDLARRLPKAWCCWNRIAVMWSSR